MPAPGVPTLADFLLDIGRNPFARRMVQNLKLPIPLPVPLRRATAPWNAKELQGRRVVVGAARGARYAPGLRQVVTQAGGRLVPFGASDEIDALLFDASSLTHPSELKYLYEFLHPRLKQLAACGRILVLGPNAKSSARPLEAVVAKALTGFAKSLGRELGATGATCQVLLVDKKVAQAELGGCIRFFLSDRAAYMSGQAIHLKPAPEAQNAALELPLKGKTALVTGAAQGIGEAICRRFAAEGAKVIGLDTDQSALTSVMKEIGGLPMVADLRSREVASRVAQTLGSELGHVDILVNNAGVVRDKTLAKMPKDFWDEVLTVNLEAPIELTDTLVNGDDELLKLLNNGGRVMMFASVSGLVGNIGQTNYAAAKAGVLAYAQALAERVARRRITVNAIVPGFVETRMTSRMPASIREMARRLNALAQGGQPADVAEIAVFLASAAAAGINGEALRICGLSLLGG